MSKDLNELAFLLPDPNKEILPGVRWGRCEELFTPAYWKIQYYFHMEEFCKEYFCVSSTLLEEICACLLGGYGMRSELGLAAFERLQNHNLLQPKTGYEELLTALSVPFFIEGRFVRYRFPKQKAIFLTALLNRSDLFEIPCDNDLVLREWLLTVRGIGMKTASWIVRNWLCSENVAILDIHIHRAGLIAGFFNDENHIEKDYRSMEKRYLEFSAALGVSPANLDSLICLQLKSANTLAINILKQKS